MKTWKWIIEHLYFVIITVLIVIILLQRSCTPVNPILDDPNVVVINKKHYEYLKHHRDTVYNTEYIYYKGDPIPGKPIPVEVPADVDTAAILQKYFTKNPYSETVEIKNENGSFGTVTVSEYVFMNKIFDRKYKFNITVPTYTETIVVKELPKRQIYAGLGMNFDQINLINSVYGGLLYKTRKDHIYGLNIGISTTNEKVTPFIGGSIYWKIKLKKDKPKYDTLEKKAAQVILDNL